jgi:hypothetical protein
MTMTQSHRNYCSAVEGEEALCEEKLLGLTHNALQPPKGRVIKEVHL